ncbi:MAG TPA: serine hydrolase [Steroidobacter sp.]
MLKPESLKAMLAPGTLNDGRPSSSAITGQHLEGGEYGYGLVIAKFADHEWIGHAGGIEGFSTFLGEIPGQRISFAVFANTLGKDKGAGQAVNRIRHILMGKANKANEK